MRRPGGGVASDSPRVRFTLNSRLAVLSLFGMTNWIYTWHNPRVDADAGELAGHMADIFLHGVLPAERPRTSKEFTQVSSSASKVSE